MIGRKSAQVARLSRALVVALRAEAEVRAELIEEQQARERDVRSLRARRDAVRVELLEERKARELAETDANVLLAERDELRRDRDELEDRVVELEAHLATARDVMESLVSCAQLALEPSSGSGS